MEVGVVLTNELIAERRRDNNARREVDIFVDSEAVAVGDGIGVEGLEKVGFGVLSVFPIEQCSGQIGVDGVAENVEQWGGALQNLGVNAVEVVQLGDVAHNPNLIAV